MISCCLGVDWHDDDVRDPSISPHPKDRIIGFPRTVVLV
jgi:hypothetical protein